MPALRGDPLCLPTLFIHEFCPGLGGAALAA